MALISNARQLIEFFTLKGEAIVKHRPEEPLRKIKRAKYLHDRVEDDVENYRARSPNSQCLSSLSQNENIVEGQQEKNGTEKEAEGPPGLQLVCLLLNCASAIEEDKKILAANLLSQLYSRVSMTGNSIERVAAHVAEALEAKLSSTSPSSLALLNKKATTTLPEEESQRFAALIGYYRVSPFYQFAHLTANQAIIEAFEGESHLHVVDFAISYGIQWSSLIQSLSERKDLPALRITGFGRDLNMLNATGIRLTTFAHSCGLKSFEFHPFLEGSKQISEDGLQIKEGETVAVNFVLYLSRFEKHHNILYSRLRCIQALKPAIVVVVEHEASHSPKTFLSRFMESLHYYAALFDSMDECLPPQSAERLGIEKFYFGEQIKNTLSEAGSDDMERRETHERWETWKARMERVGFVQTRLSSCCVSQAKLLLQSRAPSTSLRGGGFRVNEREGGKMLSLAWLDRQLISTSAWQCRV